MVVAASSRQTVLKTGKHAYIKLVVYILLASRTWINAGAYCRTSSSNQFCNRHPVCIIYLCHLVILNYFLASELPQNIQESPIEPKNTSRSSPTP